MTLLNEIAQQQIRKRTTQVVLLTLLTVILSWSGALPVPFASGEPPLNENGMTLRDVTQGSLLFKTHERGRYLPAPLLKTDVNISITGIIARTTLTQEFVNPSRVKDDWAEGIYVFPLPDSAAVDHLRMKVGDRMITGEIRDRAEAKRRYEQAKQEGTRASLVEQERPNVFTVSIANIAPGGPDHSRNRVSGNGALRSGGVLPAFPDGRGSSLHPGDAGRHRGRTPGVRLVAQYRPRRRCLTDHPARRAPAWRPHQSGEPDRRSCRRLSSGKNRFAVS